MPKFTPTPFSLSEEDREDIKVLLNLDPDSETAKRAISQIEWVSSHFPRSKEFEALEIRPANRVAELTPLLKAAKDTSRCLSEVNGSTLCQVGYSSLPSPRREWGFAINEVEQVETEKAWQAIHNLQHSLPVFIAALERSVDNLKRSESRGGKKTPALDVTVAHLILMFEEYYYPKPQETEANRELVKLDFVSTILEAASREGIIPAIPDTDEGIKTLMKRSKKSVLTAEDIAPLQE